MLAKLPITGTQAAPNVNCAGSDTIDGVSLTNKNSGFELAARFGLSAYDAVYLELADRPKAPLNTADKALLKPHKALSWNFPY